MSWPTIKLGDVITQLRGVTYSSGDAVDAPKEGYVELLRANNIYDGEINFNNTIYVPKSKVSDKQYLKENDILIAASSGSINLVGKAGAIRETRQCSFGAFCKVIRPSNKIDARYIANFFQTAYYRKKIASLAEGANINNLRSEHIDNLLIPLPPIAEQQRIASILDKAELIRRKCDLIITKLEELEKSLFTEAVQLSNQNKSKYPLKKLYELCSFSQGIQVGVERQFLERKNDSQVRFLRIIDFTNGDEPPRYIENTDDRFYLKADEVAMVRYGSPGFVCTGLEGVIANNLFKINIKGNEILPQFLIAYLKSDLFQIKIKQLAFGAALKAINFGTLHEFTMPVPPVEVQRKLISSLCKLHIIQNKYKHAKNLHAKLLCSNNNQLFNS